MSVKQLRDPFQGSSLLKKLVTILVILTFISTFFGFDRSLTAISKYILIGDEDEDYWNDWRIVTIVYYLCCAINAFFGFVGLVYDKTVLLIPFSFFLFVLFIFGLTNEALRQNVFGAVIQPITDLLTIIYIYRLRTIEWLEHRSRRMNVWTVNEEHMREEII